MKGIDKKMSRNRYVIKNELEKEGLKLGIYDKKIDRLSKHSIDSILENMLFGSTDILVSDSGEKYIVEVYHVDNEVDFKIKTYDDYIQLYGREI